MQAMNIGLIAHHTLFRDGIKLLLTKSGFLSQCIEASSLIEAVDLLKAKPYDLIICEITVHDISDLDAFSDLVKAVDSTPVLVIFEDLDGLLAKKIMSLGASASISKISPYKELTNAIASIQQGNTYISPEFKRDVAQASNKSNESSIYAAIDELSDRQREVLRHIALGESNKTISIELNISTNTVKAHLTSIFKTLGVHNRTEAFYIATRAGLTPKK